ncbi:MAG: DUF2723 domain-containing protein [Planctomycetes bacterium]|nr:DUF2723 domain-containing protein [Planctomycetota bacterium]
MISKSTIKANQAFFCWVGVFACASLLYILTLAPDLVWQDQGDYQYQVAKLVLNIPGDVVRVHPLYIVVTHFIGRAGLFSYAYCANLVSAIFTAIAVANIYLIVWFLVKRVWAGILAAGVCALGHSTWFLGVQAQTYGMANAAFTGCLLLMILFIQQRRSVYLYWLGFIGGLGISAHMMSQVGLAVIMVWLAVLCVKRKVAVRQLLFTIAAWVVGAGLLWYVMFLEYQQSGDFVATIASAITGRWTGAVFNGGQLGLLVKRSFLFFVLNFPTPLVLLAIPGLICSFRKLGKECSLLLFLSLVLYVLFAGRYRVPNQNNFFLPAYILISIYVGLGFGFIFEKTNRVAAVISAVLLVLIVPGYVGISAAARASGFNVGSSYDVPYRDVYEYYLLPWQQNQVGPRRLLNEVFEVLPEDSVFFVDSTPYSVFQYGQGVEGLREDVTVLQGSGDLEEIERYISSGRRIFTLYGWPDCPGWVKDESWLKAVAISESENIFEVVVPIVHLINYPYFEER